MDSKSKIRNSEKLFKEAKNYIPGGAQISRRPELFIPGAHPIYVEHAKGCRFTDVDGQEFIDYLMAYGPVILGYSNPQVNAAAFEAIEKGTVFTMSHPITLELAKEMIRLIPCAETVYFKKTGSGATSTAVKMARIYSGKEKVIRYGYSGWHDWCWECRWWSDYKSGAPKVLADYVIDFQYNDLDGLEKLLKENHSETACVIMEPIKLEQPKQGYLQGVRDLCDKYGILLIFDEIKTGFRLSLGGAQKYFGVTPDMATFSKGMANGFPISAVVGKKDVMAVAENMALSATFDVEIVGMAAALANIHEIEQNNVCEHLWKMGQRLKDGLDKITIETGVEAKSIGIAPMPFVEFTSKDPIQNEIAKETFYTETAKRGVFFAPNHLWYVSFAHKEEDIDETLEIAREAFKMAVENFSDKNAIKIATEKVANAMSRFPSQAKDN